MPSLVDSSPAVQQVRSAHWRRVLWFSAALLLVWALVSLGCGVWFADALNGVMLGGFPLGFWFAQQGAIVVFVLLILVYAIGMNRLERRHRDELARLRTNAPASAAEGSR
jgi:putative solute:sodium symporter small subunit